MNDFNDIVDTEGLDDNEVERLQRVHELLVAAGPPPDLPPALESPVEPTEAEILHFPHLPRRRWALVAVLAATVALIAFGGGFLTGHSHTKAAAFDTSRVVSMQGKSAVAFLKIGWKDNAGNWPMEFQVSGLPQQKSARAYYELWLSRNGKPVAPCGTFRVNARNTTIQLSVPYAFSRFDGWVVTAQSPGVHEPGTVVMST
jgi:hypothetical protein